jgi:15-cis-phytoene synthase
MRKLSVSKLVGSSTYFAIADDSIKDEDNAAWVMELDLEVRQAWIDCISWIRLVDRLAEEELLDPQRQDFQQFRKDWNELKASAQIPCTAKHYKALQGMHDRWFKELSNPISQMSIHSWDRFVQASAHYHREILTFKDLKQFETMLKALGSSFFQVFPFLEAHHWRIVGQFGMVDQFYNILRDLREDAEQGICHLPTDVLHYFGVSRDEMLDLRAYQNPGYRSMMRFWLYDYLPRLHRQAYPFILASDLHPSWQILRDWSLRRYKRIERIFRRCDYDYVRFSYVYWREVKRDLIFLLPGSYGASLLMNADTAPSFLNRKCKLTQLAAYYRIAHLADMKIAS